MQRYTLTSTRHHIVDKHVANTVLSPIVRGPVGFDVEFRPRIVPDDEAHLDKKARRELQIAKALSAGATGIALDWVMIGTCLVQIAVGQDVYVLNLKKMKAFPIELRRVLESPEILKVAAGVFNDGIFLWQDFACNVRMFVDLGWMMRVAFPERYADHSGGVALSTCVSDIFQRSMDKSPAASIDWETGLPKVGEGEVLDMTPQQMQNVIDSSLDYAALDAQASLQLYSPILLAVVAKGQELGRHIPDDWFTFNFLEGQPRRLQSDFRGAPVTWVYTACPWYVGGRFANYYF